MKKLLVLFMVFLLVLPPMLVVSCKGENLVVPSQKLTPATHATPAPTTPTPTPTPAPTPKPTPSLPLLPTKKPVYYASITIVYDNNPFDSRLRTAWGFSCLIRLSRETILFDCGGDSSILLDNMKQLGVVPGQIDAVVLSHMHEDHVGGLMDLLKQKRGVTVYLPQSFPEAFNYEVKSIGANVEEVSSARELFPGVYTTGELGDELKEQSLVINTGEGLVIITGCAHAGIINVVRAAKDMFPHDRVSLLIGGFHLSETPFVQIESIMNGLVELDVQKMVPCHCSGDEVRKLCKEQHEDRYIGGGVGKRMSVP